MARQEEKLPLAWNILVSARIAKGEQNIIDSASRQGFPVVTVEDNGFSSLYFRSRIKGGLLANKAGLLADKGGLLTGQEENRLVNSLCKFFGGATIL